MKEVAEKLILLIIIIAPIFVALSMMVGAFGAVIMSKFIDKLLERRPYGPQPYKGRCCDEKQPCPVLDSEEQS